MSALVPPWLPVRPAFSKVRLWSVGFAHGRQTVLGTRKRLLPQSSECRCLCQSVAEFVRVWGCLLCAARSAGSKDPTAVRDLLLSLLACCGIIVTKDELQLLHRTGTFRTLKVLVRPTQLLRKSAMWEFVL